MNQRFFADLMDMKIEVKALIAKHPEYTLRLMEAEEHVESASFHEVMRDRLADYRKPLGLSWYTCTDEGARKIQKMALDMDEALAYRIGWHESLAGIESRKASEILCAVKDKIQFGDTDDKV